MLRPIDTAIDFSFRLVDLCDSVRDHIEIIGRAIHTSRLLPRQKFLVHYKFMLNAFNKNSRFILDVLRVENIEVEPLRSILRTLMDLYSHSLFYANSNEKEMLKRLIGTEVWLLKDLGFSHDLHLQNQLLAEDEKLNLPTFESLAQICNDRKSKVAFEREWTFRYIPITSLISKYHDENIFPKVSKKRLIDSYKYFSTQIHGDVFLNMPGLPVNARYQVLFMLMYLQICFIRQLHTLTNFDLSKFNGLVSEAQNSNIFDELRLHWDVSQRLRNRRS